MRRRNYLAALGLAAGTGLAGCNGGSGSNNSSGSEPDGNNSGDGNESTEASGGGSTATSRRDESTATSAAGEGTGPASTTGEVETTSGQAGTISESTATTAATESETAVAGTAQPGTSASTGGGGTGSTEVSDTELQVEEGEYTTDIYMTGIVENTGSGVLRIPEARVSFYDANDSILDSSTESIAFLKPGRQWAVNVPYLGDGDPERGEIESTSTEVFQSELGVPDGLEITSQELQTGNEPSLSATVKNTSNGAVAPAVFCVFYDDGGVAMGGGLDSLEQLPAGETWQASIDFLGYSTRDATEISDYDLYANIT